MAVNPQVFGIVSQLAEQLYRDQPAKKRKANTITTVVGLVLTVLVTIITYLANGNFEWLPSWVPQLVPILGFALTALGVNKTKNGMTPSLLEELNNKANEFIDMAPSRPVSAPPETHDSFDADKDSDDSTIAAQLDALAKKFAKGF